jgi:hypothetical protein
MEKKTELSEENGNLILNENDLVGEYQKVDEGITNKEEMIKDYAKRNNRPLTDMERLELESDKKSDLFDQDEKPIGYYKGKPIFRNTDVEEIYPHKKKEEEIDLRELQFREIKKVKEEMREKNDHRHLFFIPERARVHNYGGKYFEGNLNQDILALKSEKDRNCLELKPLMPGNEIKYNFYSKRLNKSCDGKIPEGSKVKREGVNCVDLTNVQNKYEFEQLLKSKK